MISKDLQKELRQRYNPDGSILRKAQLRMLDILIFIDRICEENGLTYWLEGGTLLGAKRHGGYIPWDDDTDIGMPYKDMLKIKEILINHPSDEFVIQCNQTDSGYFGDWIVVRDLNSEYIQDSPLHNIRKYRGLQVDIFPYESTFPIFTKLGKKLSWNLVTKPLYKGNLNKKKIFRIKIFHKFLHTFLYPIFRSMGGKKENMNYSLGVSCEGLFKTTDIFPTSKIFFEGREFRAPNNVDNFLTSLYGDWEKIPSENEIKTHQASIIFK